MMGPIRFSGVVYRLHQPNVSLEEITPQQQEDGELLKAMLRSRMQRWQDEGLPVEVRRDNDGDLLIAAGDLDIPYHQAESVIEDRVTTGLDALAAEFPGTSAKLTMRRFFEPAQPYHLDQNA